MTTNTPLGMHKRVLGLLGVAADLAALRVQYEIDGTPLPPKYASAQALVRSEAMSIGADLDEIRAHDRFMQANYPQERRIRLGM